MLQGLNKRGMMRNLVIIGTSETAERVYEFVVRYNLFNVLGFSVDAQYMDASTFCGKPVWRLDRLDEYIDRDRDLLFVAIFWNRLNADRRELYERLKVKGYNFANIVSPLASVRGNILGGNCWVMDYVVIQENANIHDNVVIADFALVGHKSTIESHAFLAARSTVFGSCHIGAQTFIGVNASVFDDTVIGEKCLIGACIMVKRNVEACTVVKSSSEQFLVKKQYAENIIETKWLANHNVR